MSDTPQGDADAPVFTEAAYLRALEAIDKRARAAYLVARSAQGWECYPYEHTGGELVATIRPKDGPLAGADGQFSPKRFAALAMYALGVNTSILDALRTYLNHRWQGRPALALAMVDEFSEPEATGGPRASGGAGMAASLTVIPAPDDHRED